MTVERSAVRMVVSVRAVAAAIVGRGGTILLPVTAAPDAAGVGGLV